MLRHTFSTFIVLCLIFVLFISCSEKTQQPQQARFNTELEQAYITSVNEDFELLKASGINMDSANVIFSLGWNQFIGPMHQGSNHSSHARAVGFEEPQNIHPRLRGGEDLGTVNINYSGQQIELNKIQTPEEDIFYSNFIKPHKRHSRKRGPGGQNGSDGNIVDIQYNPSTEYQFVTTGAGNFNPISMSVTSPAELLDITSNQNGDTINVNNDLSLTWAGGSETDKIAIRILPHQFPGHGRHPHPRHFAEGIFILLDTNTGQHTISTTELWNLVNSTNTAEIAIMVTQLSISEIENDGMIYHAVMRSGDRIIVNVE